MKDHKGLTVFEYNTVTKKVDEATYKRGSSFTSFGPSGTVTNDTFVLEERPDCKYFSALNMRNALRKAKAL